jgi:hypothetical protein
MRDDLPPGSMNAFIGLDGSHGQRFSVRTASDHSSARTGNTDTTSPYWFKLTRVNDTFTGYTSHDLVHWTQIGTPATIPMNKTIYAGVAVTSHNRNRLLITGFDNVGVLQQ